MLRFSFLLEITKQKLNSTLAVTPVLGSYSAGVAQKIPDFQTDACCAIPMSPEISSNVHFPIIIKQPEINQG